MDGDRGGVNSHLNSILTQIEGSVENPSEVLKLDADGKQLIKKRQKLIKIADRNKLRRVGLWFKSTSPTISRLIHAEDEKKRFARERVLWRVKEKTSKASVLMRSKSSSSGVILSFFAARSRIVLLCEVSRWLDSLSNQPSIQAVVVMSF